MIESGSDRQVRADAGGPCGAWRRAHEVLDDYDRGGVLSEQLADDLCSELAVLRTRPGRPRRAPRTGPQPSRPSTTPVIARPRLVLVRGE